MSIKPTDAQIVIEYIYARDDALDVDMADDITARNAGIRKVRDFTLAYVLGEIDTVLSRWRAEEWKYASGESHRRRVIKELEAVVKAAGGEGCIR